MEFAAKVKPKRRMQLDTVEETVKSLKVLINRQKDKVPKRGKFPHPFDVCPTFQKAATQKTHPITKHLTVASRAAFLDRMLTAVVTRHWDTLIKSMLLSHEDARG
eukprot:337992-Pyramimonas_sp.AAC.1